MRLYEDSIGNTRFNGFVSALSDEDRGLTRVSSSSVPYRFGDSEVVNSYQNAKVPVGEQRGVLETEVIDIKISKLLVSEGSMKKIGMILNFTNDTAMINGKLTKLEITFSGHYLKSLSKYNRLTNT